jgi:hypothetical protein
MEVKTLLEELIELHLKHCEGNKEEQSNLREASRSGLLDSPSRRSKAGSKQVALQGDPTLQCNDSAIENSVMRASKMSKRTYGFRLAAMMGLGLALLVAVSLLCFGQKQSQPVFPSAEKATVAAIQKKDEQNIMRILGGGKELVSPGDDLEDEFDRSLFLQKYQQLHRFVREAYGYLVLYVGAENWPSRWTLTVL